MITYLDALYDDEILYGWLARNHYINGKSLKQTSIDYFGKSCFYQTLLCHNSLDYFINQVPNQSIQDLNDNHTLTPMYRPFVTSSEQKGLLYDNKAYAFWRHDDNYDKLKICPICYEDDIKTHGEAYLHRIHQAPGSEVCLKHNIMFNKINYSNSTYFNISNIDLKSLEIHYPESAHEKLFIGLAEDISFVLSGGLEGYDIEKVREKYVHKLRDNGYFKGTVLNIRKFEEDLILYYGESFLQIINLSVTTSSNRTWIWYFLGRPNCSKGPLKNLLTIRFLFGCAVNFANYEAFNTTYFNDRPWKCLNKNCPDYDKPTVTDCSIYYNRNKRCFAGRFKCNKCGYTYGRFVNNEEPYFVDFGDLWRGKLKSLILQGGRSKLSIANEMKCDSGTINTQAEKMGLLDILNKTVDRKTAYRQEVIKYISENPNVTASELAVQLKAQVNCLKRYDKSYFNQISLKLKRNEASKYWLEKDNQMSKLIETEISNMIHNKIRIRITIKHLSKVPKCSTLTNFTKYADKLPKTQYIIKTSCETVEQYYDRLKSYL